jgi:hypothetical protein
MILTEQQLKEKNNITRKLISRDNINSLRIDLKEPGNYFLYETITNGRAYPGDTSPNLSYPKLGIYINSYLVDMAIETQWVDVRRTWEENTEYSYEHDGNVYTEYVSEIRTKFRTLIEWGDQLIVSGIWKTIPNHKQLRIAYEETIWFKKTKSELRNLKINSLF